MRGAAMYDLRISIHALRGEGDRLGFSVSVTVRYFYPRPPWGGRQPLKDKDGKDVTISIHALRGEGDANLRLWQDISSISIHALRGEGDNSLHKQPDGLTYFYPRPPWGGRLQRLVHIFQRGIISIHALRGEGDTMASPAVSTFLPFLSTPSVGRATHGDRPAYHRGGNFYPRPPWGGRPCRCSRSSISTQFLSTPSVGRATPPWAACSFRQYHFYPRPPWGGRRAAAARPFLRQHFYPRPPWGGRQQKYTKILCSFCAKGTIISPPGGAIRCAAAKRQPQHSTTWQQNVETLGAKHPGRYWSPGVRTGVTAAKHRPAQIRGAAQRVRRGSCNGCPAGKTAGCRQRGRSAPSAAP